MARSNPTSLGNSERPNSNPTCMADDRAGGAAKEKIEDIRIFEEWLRSSHSSISISYRLHQGSHARSFEAHDVTSVPSMEGNFFYVVRV